MGDDRSLCRKWDDMETDVLVKIFKLLNMVEMGPVSQVCRLWRFTCSDPLIWKTIDFSRLKSNFIQTRVSPYIWVDDRSDKRLFRVLKLAMALSRGNVSCMIFHYNLYMKDEHLSYITERSPHLKRLVMPAWNRITKNGICQAIRRWPHLESLTMPTIGHPLYVIQEISRHCKNFTELKIMGTFDCHFASSIVEHLPNLKILSLRCSRLMKDALLMLLYYAEKLEVLNISHCLILETVGRKQVVREIDASILEAGSRMKVLVCQNMGCLTCQRMMNDEGLMRWYRYEEGFWRYDEVASLDLGENSGKLFDAECEKLTAW
ncbi:hypothetical protein LUZ61_019411 [Rhynchospora tenuis]|uniref:F-box domain-containing protein n=1 Tax=Rhynchospora tenuis TaxID=198213 RepID=A0AAD5ZB35_9POAL|nr:hypothetical protein LUZ61_019411 [Rhynchospora tenuis]